MVLIGTAALIGVVVGAIGGPVARRVGANLALGGLVGTTSRWAHFSELLAIDGWIFLLYSILYRFALVPRGLAAFGLITVMLHFTGRPLRGLLGYDLETLMGIPIALSHMTSATWLVVKGFHERDRSDS
jgi:hypothetical protein